MTPRALGGSLRRWSATPLAGGASEMDTHVKIKVNEIPCSSPPGPGCTRELNLYRRPGRAFVTVGGGVRLRLEGHHAVRAALRLMMVVNDASFLFAPDLGYEYAF